MKWQVQTYIMKYVILSFLLEPNATGDNHQISVESSQFEHKYRLHSPHLISPCDLAGLTYANKRVTNFQEKCNNPWDTSHIQDILIHLQKNFGMAHEQEIRDLFTL